MNKVSIACPVWKSRTGEIPIADRDQMTDVYLQACLKYSEYKYMQYNNAANNFVKQIEELEKKSLQAYNTSVTFSTLIKALHTEATRRGIILTSVAETNPNKFDILRKDFKPEPIEASK